MKVRLVKRQTIVDFADEHARSRPSFGVWLRILRGADWNEPGDIKALYGSVDFLGNGTNRVVFNIGGNNYRMICTYYFGNRNVHLYINWLGTHAAYTNLCEDRQQYTIEHY